VGKIKEYLTPAPPNLLDMRAAMEAELPDDSPAVQLYRALKVKNPRSFTEQLTGLEKSWQATEKAERDLRREKWAAKKAQALARAGAAEEEGPDESSEKLLQTIEEVRATLRVKQ
jgi:hypothetical protein